jgi:hypothetical protein
VSILRNKNENQKKWPFGLTFTFVSTKDLPETKEKDELQKYENSIIDDGSEDIDQN